MHLMRRLKRRQKQAAIRDKPSPIPDSSLDAIKSLPAELWTGVIEALVRDELGDPRFQCPDMPQLLRYRLVCHAFDKDLQHTLHNNITFAHIPRLPIMRTYRDESPMLNGTTYNFHTALLASGINNSSSNNSRSRQVARPSPENLWSPGSNIADRIRNCVTVALVINSPRPNLGDLVRSLSKLASMSTWARDYMFMPYYFSGGFDSDKMAQVYLEVALLVAYGYDKQDVLTAFLGEARKGLLKGYRIGWSNHAQTMTFRIGTGLQLRARAEINWAEYTAVQRRRHEAQVTLVTRPDPTVP